MRRSLGRFGTAALVAAAMVASTASIAKADEIEHASVALPAPLINFAAEYLAEDLFYRQQGLDVESRQITGIGAMNAVIAGSMDFSFSSGASIARAFARGQSLVTIATLGSESGEFIVLRKSIAEAAHFDPKAPLAERARILKGHSFGMGGIATIGDAFLKAVAKAGGIDPQDMAISPMQPQDIFAAMSREALDGFANGPPWPQQAEHDGLGVVIADGIHGDPPGYSPLATSILVTRPEFCVEHRSICVKMGHSMLLAAQYMHTHPPETAQLLKHHFPLTDDAVLFASVVAVTAMTPNPPTSEAIEFENADRMNVEAGFLKPEEKLQSYDKLFDNEFIK